MAEGENITVMIVDDVADTCDQLEKLLFFEKDIQVVAKAHNGREAVEMAKKIKPNVVLMDINMPEMDGIAATEAISADDPSIQVIIMSVQGETDYLRRAMLAGAREFLIKPVGADELYKSIRHVHKLGASRPRAAAPMASAGSPGEIAAKGGAKGQILAVFSPKGGVGTSTIAANLAIALRQFSGKKVVLMDTNLALGDLNVILNLISNTTICDLTKRITELDADLLNDVLVTHQSQVKVLLAPPNPQEGETVSADDIKTILGVLRSEYDYVIVDTHSSFQDKSLAVLDMADRILLVMTLEMTCIKNIKLFLEIADLLEYPDEKMFLILNKADNRLGIRVENVEHNIKHKVGVQIGNAAHEVTLSINQGVPMVMSNREHRVSKDMFVLAREFAGTVASGADMVSETNKQPTKKPPGKGILGLLRSFF